MTQAGISAVGRSELTRVLMGRRFVTTQGVAEALEIDADAAAKKLSRWTDYGWLRRVRRGLYIGVPVDAPDPMSWSEDPLVVAAEVWPGYFTGWTAAGEWSLTDQVFRTTVMKTTARVRSSSVRLLDHDYLIATTSEADLRWGMKTQWRADTKLRFADPARTVIDILDAPKIGGGMRHGAEILAAYLDAHHPPTLVEYGDRLGNRAVFKRLGYCVEALGLHAPDLVQECQHRLSAGVSPLDPGGPAGGRVLTRWNLRVNVTIAAENPS